MPNPTAVEVLVSPPAPVSPGREALLARIAELEARAQALRAERDALLAQADAAREVEVRRLLAVAAAGVGDWTYHVATGELDCSPHARLMHRVPADQPVGIALHDRLIHPDDVAHVRAVRAAALDPAGSGCYHAEFRFLFDDDEVRWIQSVGHAVFQDTPEGRRATDLLGAMIDVTDRRRMEESLRDAMSAAQAASQAKSQFLAVISHELRTPLTGIIGFTELLETGVLGPLAPRQHEAVGRIHGGSWHLVSIIDEILSFSRIEAGKEQVRAEDADVADLMTEVARIVEPQAATRMLRVRMRNADAPVVLRTDTGKVRQILLNLVGNAARYASPGDITVRLDDADAAVVRVHVSDEGPGIAPEDQERIFEAFTQVDGSPTRDGGGTGLGLAIARKLARLLGGDVTLRSAPGAGSTFTFTLPRQAPA